MAERRTRPKELVASFTDIYKALEPKIREAVKVQIKKAEERRPRPTTPSSRPVPLREQRRGRR